MDSLASKTTAENQCWSLQSPHGDQTSHQVRRPLGWTPWKEAEEADLVQGKPQAETRHSAPSTLSLREEPCPPHRWAPHLQKLPHLQLPSPFLPSHLCTWQGLGPSNQGGDF